MKTVLCHGCFDVLHAGHLAYFKAAKKYGDRLIVSITADRFVNKGPGRPYFSVERRAEMVRALSCVDGVFISDEPTAVGAINRFRPDFFVKGSDYKDLSKDVTGEILNEKKAVEAHGGQLVFTDEETFSSSNIINRHYQPWSDIQRSTIDRVKSLGGTQAIEDAIESLKALRILVVGEPILDVYRFVRAEGISSKSPTVSCRMMREETYLGGSTAIYNHLRSFCDAHFLTPYTKSRIVPSKVRYIDPSNNQRIFEVTEIWENDWARDVYLKDLLKARDKTDVFIVADFGHGLIEEEVLDGLSNIKSFVGLNVQTNSSNYGFNMYTKHKRYDYLCLDTREVRLASHDRFGSPVEIARGIKARQEALIGLTVGATGSYLFGADEFYSPAFSDQVIDATGAGDAYFAITSCLIARGVHPELIPFIGNVFAGLKTKILGNKSAVSKASLLKACRGILA